MNQKEALKKIHAEFCRQCERANGKKDIDKCFTCEYHKLFNMVHEKINGVD